MSAICNPLWHRPKWFFEICTLGILPGENSFCTVVKRKLLFSSFLTVGTFLRTHTSLRRKTRFIIWSHTFLCDVLTRRALGCWLSLHEVQIACLEFLAMVWMMCICLFADDWKLQEAVFAEHGWTNDVGGTSSTTDHSTKGRMSAGFREEQGPCWLAENNHPRL